MAIERERKFLFNGDVNLVRSIYGRYNGDYIQQAYLMLSEDSQLRVRIIEGLKALIAFKQTINDIEKLEYEYDIPIEDGMELYHNSKIKLTKERFSTVIKGAIVDIDVYDDGLIVVEIECLDGYEFYQIEIPEYCGKEITGDNEYSNIAIALKNSVTQ